MEDGYSICFNEWALDKNIKDELGLLLIISSLTAEKGYCYASNDYLAKIFKTNVVTISRKIKILEEKKYIEIEYEKKGCLVISRKIRLTKMLTAINKNVNRTINKNVKENNISNINNTINNKKERKKQTSYDEVINSKVENVEIKDLLYEFIKMRTLKKKPLTDRALSIQINKLFRLSSDLETQKQIIENSIVKCWDEFYELKEENKNDINKGSNEQNLSKYDR